MGKHSAWEIDHTNVGSEVSNYTLELLKEYDELFRAPAAPEVQTRTKIRVTFNRKLTYSEREQFRIDWNDDTATAKFTTETRKSKESVVWISERIGVLSGEAASRWLYSQVAAYVEENYVNVHPRAVYTEIPRVRV